jgi:hypothetical protein
VKTAQLDIWCTTFAGRDNVPAKACESLQGLGHNFPGAVDPAFIQSIPESEREDGPPAYLGVGASSVVVGFHDIDALRANRLQARQPGRQ